MTPERRQQLEAAGFVETTPADLFGLSEADCAVVRLRLDAAREVRRLREAQGLTQRQLAERLNVKQSRIPAIEKGEGASLEAIMTAYIALGGRSLDLATGAPPRPRQRRPAKHYRMIGPLHRPAGLARRKTHRPVIA